jgi:hypothetical protein
MNRLSPEEAREAKIAELTAKNTAHTQALLAIGDLTTVREVGNMVTDYFAYGHDHLNALVLGHITFVQLRDELIENDAEVEAIRQVEKLECDRAEDEQEARIQLRVWEREFSHGVPA